MAAPGTQAVPTTASIEMTMEKTAQRGRAPRLPWILFLVIGVPFGLMAALGPLAAAGIYIEPLRPFWQPWPPDVAKPFIGAAGFIATLAYLVYKIGRMAGFQRGTVAVTAAFRNLLEGRGRGAGHDPNPPALTSPASPPVLPAPSVEPSKELPPATPPPLEVTVPEDTL